MNTPTQSQPPAAGEAAHTFRTFQYSEPGPLGAYPLIWGCTVRTVMGAILFTAYGDTEAESIEYAKNRLRACNSHAALVEALERAQADLELAHGGRDTITIRMIRAALEQARKP